MEGRGVSVAEVTGLGNGRTFLKYYFSFWKKFKQGNCVNALNLEKSVSVDKQGSRIFRNVMPAITDQSSCLV